MNRRQILWIVVIAVITTAIVALAGRFVLEPPRDLIVDARFSHERITPNADGMDDITEYAYELSDNAIVSLIFQAEDGTTYAFRENEQRSRGEYSGLFSGVVDGYLLDGETIEGTVLRRLIPNGVYTWQLTAATDAGRAETRTGTLEIADADAALPLISTFTISPTTFSPNQDGIQDRAQINVYLEKDADLDVYLTAEGVQIYIPPQVTETRDGEAGRYTYDYDGGIDGGSEPPVTGEYTVIAVAQDAVGQRIQREGVLEIAESGRPRAEITSQPGSVDVMFTVMPYDAAYASGIDFLGDPIAMPEAPQDANRGDITMPVGDVLVFRLTIENYSDVPIRTHDAPPGTVYEQTQRAATLGGFDQSGAWRVGLDCDTAVSDYPWRWRVGDDDTLETVYDEETDNTYYYLMPGERAVVWGGIRMTELVPSRNPQNCWAGLIHEDVAVSIYNARVGARSIELVDPDALLYDNDNG